MRALLDVNILIALLDPDHTFHERAHDWWAANSKRGWASCPLVENGVVRIMSNPNYSKTSRFTPAEVIRSLRRFAEQNDHEFWPDEISLRNEELFAADRMHSSQQLGDLYLLALATHRRGRLVTFDQGIPISAIRNATAANLCIP